jgi:hypothetical protein
MAGTTRSVFVCTLIVSLIPSSALELGGWRQVDRYFTMVAVRRSAFAEVQKVFWFSFMRVISRKHIHRIQDMRAKWLSA